MPLRILIADDEPIEHRVLGKIIADSGLPAVVAHLCRSGGEVLEAFGRVLPDLIFMDIRMPGMSGLDAAAAVKKMSPNTKIAMITAYDDFRYAKRAIDIHIDYFLLKPVEPAEVERVVRETLRPLADDSPGRGSAVSPGRALLARNAADLLHRHYAEPIALAWLAERMNASPQYLNRTFKETYGTTIMSYLSRFRIELAERLLTDPELTVADVAERVGIPDASYFGQLFKQTVGLTPSQYRIAHARGRNGESGSVRQPSFPRHPR